MEWAIKCFDCSLNIFFFPQNDDKMVVVNTDANVKFINARRVDFARLFGILIYLGLEVGCARETTRPRGKKVHAREHDRAECARTYTDARNLSLSRTYTSRTPCYSSDEFLIFFIIFCWFILIGSNSIFHTANYFFAFSTSLIFLYSIFFNQ